MGARFQRATKLQSNNPPTIAAASHASLRCSWNSIAYEGEKGPELAYRFQRLCEVSINVGACRMGKLLCHCRLGGRCAYRTAIRGPDSHRHAATDACGGCGCLVLSALAAPSRTREALFGVGAAALLLLFVSIHNAWTAQARAHCSGRGGKNCCWTEKAACS